MEQKTFKKIFNGRLLLKNFSKNGSYYYHYLNDLVIVIGLQKSSYSNSYYINIGYIIKELNPSMERPRDVDGDIRARFSFEEQGKKTDNFDLDEFMENEEAKLTSIFDENIHHYVTSVTSVNSLKILLEKNPVMLYQTKQSAKRLMGLEE